MVCLREKIFLLVLLLIDAFSLENMTSFSHLTFPIVLFITAQILLDVVWRLSKLKGLVEGYDAIFANLHHIVGKHFCIVVVSIFVLLIVNMSVFFFMLVWCIAVVVILFPMAVKLNQLSNEMAESKHKVIGRFSDNITNIFSLFYFAKRKAELKYVNQLMSNDYAPRQIKLLRSYGTVRLMEWWFNIRLYSLR
jgi:ATP-binding cassette subfamily B protein